MIWPTNYQVLRVQARHGKGRRKVPPMAEVEDRAQDVSEGPVSMILLAVCSCFFILGYRKRPRHAARLVYTWASYFGES